MGERQLEAHGAWPPGSVVDDERLNSKQMRQRRRTTGDRALGDRIRKLRTRLNLSQEVTAHRIGRSEGWLLQAENGRADPGYTDLLRLAPVLEAHISQLLPALPAASHGPLPLGRMDLPADLVGITGRSDVLDLDALELQMQQYGRQVHTDKPRHLLLRLHGHLGSLRAMLAESHGSSAARQLQRRLKRRSSPATSPIGCTTTVTPRRISRSQTRSRQRPATGRCAR